MNMKNEMTGSCHCGSIKFEITDKPKITVNCHCDECKKRNGSAFSTYIAVAEGDFVLTNGGHALKQYEITSEGIKYFCPECGSPIYNKNYRFPGLYMVFYGAFTQAKDYKPAFNVFCASKHDWVDAISDITSFQAAIER